MHELEKSGNGQSPVKLALAIGLTVVFVVVVAAQVWGYSRAAKEKPRAVSKGTPVGRPTADRFEVSRPDRLVAPGRESKGEWPEPELAECMEYDPFATPRGFTSKKNGPVPEAGDSEALQREIEIAKKRATQEQEIAKLQEAGVNAILKGSKRSAAMLGTQMVRVGEEINGFRVRSIESDGIVIERPAVR